MKKILAKNIKYKRKYSIGLLFLSICIVALFKSCSPIREFTQWEKYEGVNDFIYTIPEIDTLKKNVVIIADNDGTEVFDMLAPFYLFNATENANVFIVAEKFSPISVMKGLFILPHLTFDTFSKLNIKPDLLIVPNLAEMSAKDINPNINNWIKEQYNTSLKILAVCDGALTVAATGIYDGIPLTAHASDIKYLKRQLPKPLWVRNVSVTKSENQNLYSTAGVSNATEGSLKVINDMFGPEIMQKAMDAVNYPFSSLRYTHESTAVDLKYKLRIVSKVAFRENKRIGVFLQEGVNEFELAAVIDTYHRTFPKQINSYSANNLQIKSKYGLTIIPTGNLQNTKIDEMHFLETIEKLELNYDFETITYEEMNNNYIFDYLLLRVKELYGENFMEVVKLLLDYN